ncbi:hypothetical protein CR513_01704, partial [Mucuna pruriens]
MNQLQPKGTGQIPSQTILSPQENMSVITLRSVEVVDIACTNVAGVVEVVAVQPPLPSIVQLLQPLVKGLINPIVIKVSFSLKYTIGYSSCNMAPTLMLEASNSSSKVLLKFGRASIGSLIGWPYKARRMFKPCLDTLSLTNTLIGPMDTLSKISMHLDARRLPSEDMVLVRVFGSGSIQTKFQGSKITLGGIRAKQALFASIDFGHHPLTFVNCPLTCTVLLQDIIENWKVTMAGSSNEKLAVTLKSKKIIEQMVILKEQLARLGGGLEVVRANTTSVNVKVDALSKFREKVTTSKVDSGASSTKSPKDSSKRSHRSHNSKRGERPRQEGRMEEVP